MLSADDWADVLWEGLKRPDRPVRVFLSEYEIKRRIGPEKVLRVPRNAILSPLALDWLPLSGVRVVREA